MPTLNEIHSLGIKYHVEVKYKRLANHDHRPYEGCKRGSPLSFTLESLTEIVTEALVDGRCYHCMDNLTIFNFAIDHMQALSVGGKSELVNFRVICRRCNNRKKCKSDETFHKEMAVIRLLKLRPKVWETHKLNTHKPEPPIRNMWDILKRNKDRARPKKTAEQIKNEANLYFLRYIIKRSKRKL